MQVLTGLFLTYEWRNYMKKATLTLEFEIDNITEDGIEKTYKEYNPKRIIDKFWSLSRAVSRGLSKAGSSDSAKKNTTFFPLNNTPHVAEICKSHPKSAILCSFVQHIHVEGG